MSAAIFSLSVDDGHPLDMRMADLLRKHGMTATFHVPVRNSEGPPVLSVPHLRELAKDFEIGSHTLEHRYLARLDMHEALRQITEGKRALQDVLGKVSILHQCTEALLHHFFGDSDFGIRPNQVRNFKKEIVEQVTHDGMQSTCADIFHFLIDQKGKTSNLFNSLIRKV